MHILDTIVAYKKKEVALRKAEKGLVLLKESPNYSRVCHSMKKAIRSEVHGGIISEFKRKSPSKQAINLTAKLKEVTTGYMEAGVTGLSILTDNYFFGGSENDLREARENVSLPLLRKDFIIDRYQIHAAKAMGADIVLLIARILTREELVEFAKEAQDLGMEVLVEIHDQKELDKCVVSSIDIIGVNNRNIDTFLVDYVNSINLAKQLPSSLCKISESGINDIATMVQLRKAGFDGFLIGEAFMKSTNPSAACAEFLNDYKSQISQQ